MKKIAHAVKKIKLNSKNPAPMTHRLRDANGTRGGMRFNCVGVGKCAVLKKCEV